MKCLIIDDEPLALTQLSGYISRIPFLTLVASCQDACQASEILAHTPVDLLFADINMPDLNGIDFVRSLPNPPMVIFTTAYSEYAIEGFRLECLRAAEKARQMYGLTHNTAEPEEEKSTLFVKSEYKVIRIDKEKILYIEGMSEYVCIYMEDRPKPVITLNSLQKLSAILPPNFMRVHRSYIVNLNKITENYKEQFMAYIHRLGLI